MLTEIFTVDDKFYPETSKPVTMCAVQYHVNDSHMEHELRKYNPIFDVEYPNMSDGMKQRLHSPNYRTAVYMLHERHGRG